MDHIRQLLDFDTTAIQEFSIDLVGVILLISVGYFIARIIRQLSFKALQKAKLDLILSSFLSNIIYWMMLTLILLACLSIFGVQTTSVAALIGATGLAIGLAFQGALSNFAAGVMLAIFRPFKTNSYITVTGFTGTVKGIDLFTTTLRTLDNHVIIVPNAQVFGSPIEVYNAEPIRRVNINVGIAYEADLEESRKILQKATEFEGSLNDPPSEIVMKELGDSSVLWNVRVWCKSENFWTVREKLVVNV